MELLQRWILLLLISFINVELFNTNDWQFWIISGGLGVVCSPLFKRKK